MRIRDLAARVVGTAVCVAAVVAQDVPASINMKPDEARGYVFGAMKEGRIGWAGYEMPFKTATGEARVALINSVLGWAKAYTESEPFAAQYTNLRKRLEPRTPRPRKPADEELTRQKADLDRRIAAEKRRLETPPGRGMTPEQVESARKATEGRLKDLEAKRVRFDDPQVYAEMRDKLDAEAASEKQQYESERAKWEEQYPPDFRTLIAKRLRTFLTETADVDFAANLVPCAGSNSWRKHQCFANPNYEKKSLEWKLSYRVGKPSLDAARTFATNWLAELEKK